MFSNLPGPVLIIIYLVLATALCFLSKKLADYVDALDKKTKISGAFIGAVLLAAITSLPELFTSISATILIPDSANLVVGNILGSNLFNLAIIGLAFILFFKSFAKNKIQYKSHFIVMIGVIAIYGVISYGLLGNHNIQPIFANSGYLSKVNFLVIIVMVIYIITIIFQPKESENNEEEKIDPYTNITLKQVIIRFIICAILLVGTSILITYDTDAIAKEFNLDASLAGAIFLAIATSLPELISTLSLCRKGNFDAAIGDIVGSNLFNFLIICIAEFMAFKICLLPGYNTTPDVQNALYMIFLALSVLVFLIISLFVHFISNKKDINQTKSHYALYITSGLILISGYIIFLIISK